jgi:hypothetical protein
VLAIKETPITTHQTDMNETTQPALQPNSVEQPTCLEASEKHTSSILPTFRFSTPEPETSPMPHQLICKLNGPNVL